jgi:hypothetical protein
MLKILESRRTGIAAARLTFGLALLSGGASGCQVARMDLPESLAGVERLEVRGRQGLSLRQRIRFGEYETSRVSRSWTRVRDRGATSTARQHDRRQEYRFILSEGGVERWSVSCLSTLRAFVLEAGGVEVRPSDESALFCNLQSLQEPEIAWELQLREQHERPLQGVLSRGGERIAVRGTNRSQGPFALGSTTGFELGDSGSAAAVEVINSGAVFLPATLTPERRSLLATAAAALLALEDPRGG